MTPGQTQPATCQGPDPEPRPAHFAVPADACDCHAHVFGPPSRYPYRPGRRYTPAAAGAAEYGHVLATLGIARAVIVQPEIYEDNQATIDILAQSGGAWRGIARLDAGLDDKELAKLHAHGFRGVRLNGRGALADLPGLEAMASRIAPFGWHIQLHMFSRDLPRLADRLHALPVDVVFDHFGRPDTAQGLDQDGFPTLLDLLAAGHSWVKLSAPYRFTDDRPPYAALLPFAQALVKTAPGRLVWGSDWPHSSHAGFMPNDGALLDLLAAWAPDPAVRNAILTDNPARLYGFGPPTAP